jgi:hypothetical protein
MLLGDAEKLKVGDSSKWGEGSASIDDFDVPYPTDLAEAIGSTGQEGFIISRIIFLLTMDSRLSLSNVVNGA